MANVNLISGRRADRVRMNRVSRALLMALVGTVTVGLGGVTFMLGQWVVANGRIDHTEKQLEVLKPILTEIEAAKGEREQLMPRLTTLTEAQKQTTRWHGMMEGLKRAIPEQTWLTNLTVERTAEGPTAIKLNGITIDQTRVGETMLRLSQQQEFYTAVDLRYTAESRTSDQDNVEFELAAQLNLPKPPKKETEGNAAQSK